ncbi:MAG TPA: twin-arginine translocation signal domain-containing protein [Opitutaceae bacterium]|nr:twin-arginine translocation signal domain-containing protein [Opitutaceae bacterium]
MNTPDNDRTHSITRRDFVRTAALAATAVGSGLTLASSTARAAAETAPGVTPPMIGFQAEVSYILQYGINKFLDDVQTRASVNMLFLHAAPFEVSYAGLDRSKNPDGNFAAAHPQYYQNVGMKPQPLAAGDFNLPDAMQKITAETRKRGIKVAPWMEEDNRAPLKIKGMDQLYEVDLHGRRTGGHPGGPCLNNPYFRNLISGMVEDYVRDYQVDAVQRGSERQGPLGNALGAWHHGSRSDPGQTSCFCEHCAAKAAKQGIDIERVKKAYLALEPYVRDGRDGKRPRDGYYVEFWRLLLRYPELLVWETFWADSMREMQRELYAKAKSIRPEVQVGFHIWHNASFNPIYRAEQDYKPYTEYSDFLKPVIYDNPAAERMTSYVYSVGQNIYGDLSRQQLLDFEYSIMGLTKEKSYDQIIGQPEEAYEKQLRELPINGTPRGKFEIFSADYVYQETKRAVEAVAGTKTRICPGVGIDVVQKSSTPESVREVVHAVFKAGGTGMVLSTSHAAMQPQNLSAVGATLRELKLV